MSLPITESVSVQTVLVPINPPNRTANWVVEESSLVLMDIFAEPLLVEGGLTVLSDKAVGSGISTQYRLLNKNNTLPLSED